MKVAITFFGKKDKDKYKHKYKNIDKLYSSKKVEYESIFLDEEIKIKNSYIIISFFIALFAVLKLNGLDFLSSNIYNALDNKINVSEVMLSYNTIFNNKNYTIYENKKEKANEEIPEEYSVLDKIAEEYLDQEVFNFKDNNNIVITGETDVYQKLNVCGIDVVNYSSNRNIDWNEILNLNNVNFSKENDKIFLYTTHTSESYANSEKYSFEYTSPRRTLDGNYNMLYIETCLAKDLENKGITAFYSLTPHDYGEYNSAYMNSRKTLSDALSQDEKIRISVDVHRDAIEDLNFAPKVNIHGYDCACLMLVMGIGYDGNENIYYKQNLKLAFEIQMLANKVYPGLFRQMIIRNSIYNQDLRDNSFLIEVGASGNTIDEAKLGVRCLSNLINILYNH